MAVQLTDSKQNGLLGSILKKQDSAPIRTIISRFMDKNVTTEEVSLILQLFIYYAKSYDGAVHLSKINLLDCLMKTSIL